MTPRKVQLDLEEEHQQNEEQQLHFQSSPTMTELQWEVKKPTVANRLRNFGPLNNLDDDRDDDDDDDDDNSLTTEEESSIDDESWSQDAEHESTSCHSLIDNLQNDKDNDDESCTSFFDDEHDERPIDLNKMHSSTGCFRSVRFGYVQVREYAVTVGDHPSTRDSCPITLDWKHAAATTNDLESYENKRFFLRSPRGGSGSASGGYSAPRRLSLEQRRQRVRETSKAAQMTLREMELSVAMKRLHESMQGMSAFWRKMDTQKTHHQQQQHQQPQQQQQQDPFTDSNALPYVEQITWKRVVRSGC